MLCQPHPPASPGTVARSSTHLELSLGLCNLGLPLLLCSCHCLLPPAQVAGSCRQVCSRSLQCSPLSCKLLPLGPSCRQLLLHLCHLSLQLLLTLRHVSQQRLRLLPVAASIGRQPAQLLLLPRQLPGSCRLPRRLQLQRDHPALQRSLSLHKLGAPLVQLPNKVGGATGGGTDRGQRRGRAPGGLHSRRLGVVLQECRERAAEIRVLFRKQGGRRMRCHIRFP